MKAIMSIKPEYVKQIIEGNKKFEFRRSIFKQHIESIIVYSSSPVQLLVGEIIFDNVLFLNLEDLWNQTKKDSGISESFFYDYFQGLKQGYAISIKNFIVYEKPLNILDTYGKKPPQSFLYVN